MNRELEFFFNMAAAASDSERRLFLRDARLQIEDLMLSGSVAPDDYFEFLAALIRIDGVARIDEIQWLLLDAGLAIDDTSLLASKSLLDAIERVPADAFGQETLHIAGDLVGKLRRRQK